MPDAVAAPVAAVDTSPAPSADTSPAESIPSTEAAPAASPEQAAAPAKPKPAPKPEPRRFKVKVDGQEAEIDEAELVRSYQTRAAAAKRMEEVARLRKEIEAQQAAAKKQVEDPQVKALMEQHGMTAEDASAFLRVQKLMEREQMSPEARALADERAKREETERKLKEREEAEQKTRLDAETQAEIAKLNREIPAAAAKLGLPKSPRVGKLMIQHMQIMAQSGLPTDVEEAGRYAMDVIQKEHQAIVKSISDDAGLVKYLGKEVVDRILKHSVAMARGQTPGQSPQVPTTPAPAPDAKPQTMLTPEEWRKKYAI